MSWTLSILPQLTYSKAYFPAEFAIFNFIKNCFLHTGMLDKEGQEADSRDSFEMHHNTHQMEPSVNVNVPVSEPQRPTVIESSQPHIIECTWARLALTSVFNVLIKPKILG